MRRVLILIAALLTVGCGSSDDRDEEITFDDSEGGGEDTSDQERAASPELVVGEDACETDADCVPAGCCHTAACVSREHAPSCEDVMCTADCQFNTLDCGGACLCHEGRCAARLSAPPDLEAD